MAPPEQQRRPELTFVGDVMPGGKVAEALQRVGAERAADRLHSMLHGKLVIGNLECALCDFPPRRPFKDDGAPNLRAPLAAAQWLRAAGFNVVSLANNHVMDCGDGGLESTMEALRLAGIAFVGAGMNLEEAMRPVVLKCDTRQVALLAFGVGQAARKRSAGISPYNSDMLARALDQVPPSVDAVIVMVHVGIEFLEFPESHLREFAGEALAGGADVVIGGHPHCIRGIQQGQTGAVFYSLGDFLTDVGDETLLARHLQRTALSRLGFDAAGARSCRQSLLCDLFLDAPGKLQCRLRGAVVDGDLLPRPAADEEHRSIMERLEMLSAPLNQPDAAEMELLDRIERAYRMEYGGRKLGDYFLLPFRLRARHLAYVLRRMGHLFGKGKAA